MAIAKLNSSPLQGESSGNSGLVILGLLAAAAGIYWFVIKPEMEKKKEAEKEHAKQPA